MNNSNNDHYEHFTFILFVVDRGSNSVQAKKNLEQFCQQYLAECHEIKVVDVLSDFQTAIDYNILLTPSVVVTRPEPRKIIHGDLSDTQKFAEALNIKEEKENDK